MIDKRSKQLLDFMISKPNSSFNYIDDEYPDEFGDSNQFRSMVDYLKSENYVDYIKASSSQTIIGFSLTHKGNNYKEFQHLTFKAAAIKFMLGFASGVGVTVLSAVLIQLL